jgi:hypothetical protein
MILQLERFLIDAKAVFDVDMHRRIYFYVLDIQVLLCYGSKKLKKFFVSFLSKKALQ